MDRLQEGLDGQGIALWKFGEEAVQDGSVYPLIWEELLEGRAEVSL